MSSCKGQLCTYLSPLKLSVSSLGLSGLPSQLKPLLPSIRVSTFFFGNINFFFIQHSTVLVSAKQQTCLSIYLVACLLVCLFVCLFLGQHPQHMEVKLQPPAYITVTATQDPSHDCNLHHSSKQHQIFNPVSEARDQTIILGMLVRFITAEPQWELQTYLFKNLRQQKINQVSLKKQIVF